MPLAYVRVTASGATDTFDVPFLYLRTAHVEVYVDGDLQDPSLYTWPDAGHIKFTAGNVAAGVIVYIRRRTPTTPLVTWTEGALDSYDLNTADRQALYVAEEARDLPEDILEHAEDAADRAEQAALGAGNGPGLVNSLSQLKAYSTASKTDVDLRDTSLERDGDFQWHSGDQSADLVVQVLTTAVVSSVTDTVSLQAFVISSINAGTDTLTTSAPHGLATGTRLTLLTSTANGVTQYADYYAIVTGASTLKLAKNIVAALAGSAVDITGTTTPMTFSLVHDLRSGDPVMLETAINGLPANTRLYAIFADLGSIKFASTYENARNGAQMDITGTTNFSFKHLKDAEEGRFVTKPTDPMSGLSGAWARGGVKYVTPYQMGASGRGLVDDSKAFQAAMNYAKRQRVPMIIESGDYLISYPLYFITTRSYHHTNHDLGIRIYGEGVGKTRLLMSAAFPDNNYALNLDANPSVLSDQFMLVKQGPHEIGGFSIEGLDLHTARNTGGIRFRGVETGTFEGIHIYRVDGRGFYHNGTTVSTRDDVDTSQLLSFRNCRIEQTGKEGYYGGDARGGCIVFDNNLFTINLGGNAVVSAAGFTAISNSFGSGGKLADNTTGGLRIIQSATAAQNRAIVVMGNVFEAGFWHDLRIDRAAGVIVAGNAFHPYEQTGGAGQVNIDIGDVSVDGIIIQGNRWQDYTKVTNNIPAINVKDNTSNIQINGNSIADEAKQPVQYTANVNNIFRDGRSLNPSGLRPRFRAVAAAGSDVANLTGDGTDLTSVAFAGLSSITETYDHGGCFTTGLFTAFYTGLYHFDARIAVQDFSTTNTAAELALIVNPSGSPVRHLLQRETLSSPAATRRDYSGHIQLNLVAGDTVCWAFKVSGTGKTVDIIRASNPDTVVFAGHLIA